MGNLVKIAVRNLFRYKRRTVLTTSLIAVGVTFVLGYISISGSFKDMMIGQITDSMLGHLQVHRRGYVASIENLPLNLNMSAQAYAKVESILKSRPEVEAFSPRVKFGGMFSNFVETTNIRLNGVDPEREFKTVPLLPERIAEGNKTLNPGEILIPELLARGMKVKPGDMVVVVATNKDGSVNGKQFKVSGILESATGPGGRDGYIHIADAREVLRMVDYEISEVAVRLKEFGKVEEFTGQLSALLPPEVKQKRTALEVHSWEQLTPFYNVARMIDMMTIFIQLMLIAVVLISIMNVMIMAVYERVREIGTIAAIGTLPGKILSMFIIEGLCLGVIGVLIGNIIGLAIIFFLNVSGVVTFDFGRQRGLVLAPTVNPLHMVLISTIVILVSVLASLQPALKASRMDPIQALRHV